jgi:hypothetical protein
MKFGVHISKGVVFNQRDMSKIFDIHQLGRYLSMSNIFDIGAIRHGHKPFIS